MTECSVCGQKCTETYFALHMVEHITEQREADRD